MQGHLKVSTRMLGFVALHLFSGYFKYQNGEFCWQIRIGWKKLNQTEHIETLQNETYREKESEKEQEKRDEEVPQKAEPTNIPTKKEPQEKKVKRNRTSKRSVGKKTGRKVRKRKNNLCFKKIKYTYQTMCDK